LTTPLAEATVLQACRTLFGPGPDISRGFLHYIQPDGARSAYRRKAKETHPDFYCTEDSRVQQQQTALFRDILDAYDIINRFFKEREEGRWTAPFDAAPRPDRKETYQAWSSRSRSARQQSSNDYYRGPVPLRVLEFGRYLYYTGNISFRALIGALTWQRMQRPVIGSVALRWGWLGKASIERITAAPAMPGRFGEKAVRLGLLSDFQIRTLLYYQRTQQERIGKYFALEKILTGEQLEHLAQKLYEHNALVLSIEKGVRRRQNIVV
jgi:hypothetical protein